MKVSLNGVSNQCFFVRFFEKRIYCKSESNWFLRLFERPIPIYVTHAPIDINYYFELNGLPLGSAENFDDGVIFNLLAANDTYSDCHHFLTASRDHSYTLSIYDTNHSIICDYRSATGTMSNITGPASKPYADLTHYKKVTFNWEYMSNGHGMHMLQNPLNRVELQLANTQADLERSQRALKEALVLKRHEKMDYPFPLDTLTPEISAPLSPTRNIKVCKE